MKRICIVTGFMGLIVLAMPTWAACNANQEKFKPNSIYTDHGNGTVTDRQTGLMWMQCTQGQSGAGCAAGSATPMNWKQALEAAQTANNDATFGYTDWRLPSVVELRTLFEDACYTPAINTVVFPATVSDYYWSASPYAGANSGAWVFGFNQGDEYLNPKGNNFYVRLVRGGQ